MASSGSRRHSAMASEAVRRGAGAAPRALPQIDQLFEHRRAEDLEYALPQRRDGRDVQQLRWLWVRRKGFLRMGQAVMRDQ